MISELMIIPPQSTLDGDGNPREKYKIEADSIDFEWQMQYPGTATITILTRWVETYWDESDAASALQVNAFVTYREGSTYLFRGNIFGITRQVVDGIPVIILDVMDKMMIAKQTIAATAAGEYIFRTQTTLQSISNVRLYPGNNYSELKFQYTYYPKYDSSAWIGTASSTLFIIIDNMPNNSSDISALKVGSSSAGGYPGIPPSGFFSVAVSGNTEFCQYNGLQYNQADGFWYALSVKRVRLGSTQVDPDANASAYSRICKRIAAESTVLLEGVYSGDTANTPLPDRHYETNFADGSFIFGVNPLDLRGGADYDYIRASYQVYKEDGTSGEVVTLGETFETVLSVAATYGGAALSTGYSITLSPDPAIARVVVQEPTYVDDFIRRLLFELGLNKGTSNDLIGYFYNASDDKIHIDSLVQGTPTRYYTGERSRTEQVSVDDVRSAILVKFEEGGGFNLISGTRCWHEVCYTDGTSPTVYYKDGGTWAQGTATYPHNNNATSNKGSCVITDNDAATGFALQYTADGTTSGDTLFYAWFPGTDDTTPSTWYINKVVATLEFTGTIAGPMEVTVKKVDDFTFVDVDTEPTGTPSAISPALTQIWGLPDDNYPASIGIATATLTAENLFVPTKALCIYFKNLVKPAAPMDTSKFAFKILDLYVEGVRTQTQLVKLASAYSATDSNLLVAPDSFAKAVDSSTAQHLVGVLDIGPSTREVALNLGWLQLLQTLALSQARMYTIDSTALDSQGIPIVGETIQMSDGFNGLVDYVRYSVNSGGKRELEVRMINYNTTLFGMSV